MHYYYHAFIQIMGTAKNFAVSCRFISRETNTQCSLSHPAAWYYVHMRGKRLYVIPHAVDGEVVWSSERKQIQETKLQFKQTMEQNQVSQPENQNNKTKPTWQSVVSQFSIFLFFVHHHHHKMYCSPMLFPFHVSFWKSLPALFSLKTGFIFF